MEARFFLRLGLGAVLLGGGAGLGRAAEQSSAAGVEFFERKIRPLFAEHCVSCHGEEKQKGDLRLDGPGGIRAGGENGPVFAAGNPEESRLVRAVSYQDPELQMPPKTKLGERYLNDLKEWIRRGAPMPAGESPVGPAAGRRGFQITEKDRLHWAFQPVRTDAAPPGGNPIDGFARAKLEEKGLRPNPPATRRELIRRAYYDLTGLPPAVAEVEAFLADESPGAWEALVDRLLASPRYGEKWGRFWLDLMRFAETNSYERDGPKPHAWRYRDYVIRSFNADKPYDRFVREHLAGDEWPEGGVDALIATGFYRLGIWDDEPVDRELARYDGLDDVMTVMGQVFMGLTVDCARCHDHKIDPISQKDYYRLLSFFQNINHYRNGGPTDEAPLFESDEARRDYEARVRELEEKRNRVQASVLESERIFREKYVEGDAAAPDLDDLMYRFYRDTWETLPDFSRLKAEEEGRAPSGFIDLAFRSRDEAFGFVFEGVLLAPREGEYTFYLDSDDGSRVLLGGKEVLRHDGARRLGEEKAATVKLAGGRVPIVVEYFQKDGAHGLKLAWSGPDFGRRWLSRGGDSRAERAEVAKKEFGKLMKEEGKRVLGADAFDGYQAARKELENLKNQQVPVEKALVVSERGTTAPETFVLLRGNPGVKGEKVEPGFLEVLERGGAVRVQAAPTSKTTGRRTELARWLTSPENPLTARVMMNRVWQYHFGQGLVRTPNNFGVQGERPSHPELLDFLAKEFMAGGWRLKAMHRLIMTSEAYQRSSRGQPEGLEKDPQNQWLWRFEMRRLTAEEIRDSILAINGTLNSKMFGPSIYADIPKEVMAGQSVPGSGWGKSSPEEQARRSIYIYVKRSLLTPILESFDLAETDRPVPVRFATIQPTQALGMLNGAFLNQEAAKFADRLRKEAGPDLRRQVELGLYLATLRRPAEAEIKRGVDLVEALRSENGVEADVALAYFCLITLNLNETIYLD